MTTPSRMIAALVCGALFCAPSALAQKNIKPAKEGAKPGEWTYDLPAAKAAAAAQKLPILAFITTEGCAPSKVVLTQVFGQPAWQKYAKENLLLVWVDRPASAEAKPNANVPEAFRDLHKHFNVGSPSYFLIGEDGAARFANWSGGHAFYTVEYFIDLVKFHLMARMDVPPPEKKEGEDGDGEAKVAEPAKPVAPPKPAPPKPAFPKPGAAQGIKAATEGAKPGEWTMDFEAAQKLAAEKDAPILVFLTGSDWNRAGQAMTKNLFGRPGLQQYAKNAGIPLVLVDLPEDPALVPEKFAEQNARLRKENIINKGMFPACVLLSSDGFIKLENFEAKLLTLTQKDLQDAMKTHLPKPQKKK